MKVLNFGSMNIDYVYSVEHFVKKGETISSRGLEVFSGGKGLNQSIALAKADVEVYHAGQIGEDGKFLLDILKEAGVHTEYIKISKENRTGNAIIQNDASGDNCIILYGGANRSITRAYVDEVLEGFSAGDYLLLQNEINEIAYIMQRAKEKNMHIFFNPSPMEDSILTYPLEYVDCFLLNEVEAEKLSEREGAGAMDMLHVLREKFPMAEIVLTLGEKGSILVDGDNLYKAEAKRVKAIDTTAAGDTYTGYFISGIYHGLEKERILELSSMAAAIAVTKKGAANSIPKMSEVLEQV